MRHAALPEFCSTFFFILANGDLKMTIDIANVIDRSKSSFASVIDTGEACVADVDFSYSKTVENLTTRP
jgi:hypothetical protein